MGKIGNTVFAPSERITKTAVPLMLFVVCFVIRFLYITKQDICIDEPFSIYHAQGSLTDIIRFLWPTNNPPLFEIILHYWIKCFGISSFSVRLMPVIFGSLVVIYVYKIGAHFFSFAVGLGAALLYCFSTHGIYYAHDCRAYTLFALLGVASVYYLLKLLNNGSLKSDLTVWILVNVLLIYSHYFGFVLLFAEFIVVLFFRRKHIKTVLIGFGFTTLLYLPQLFILISRFRFSATEGTWVKEPVGIESIYNMLWTFSNMPITAVLCVLLMLISLVMFVMNKKKQPAGNKMDGMIHLFFFLPFFLMFFVSFKIPVYNGRYLFFLIPFYYLSLSIMIFRLFKSERIKYTAMTVLVLLFIVTVQLNPDKKRDAKAVTEFIKQNKKPGDLVIICTHEFLTNFAYYYSEDMFKTLGGDEYGALEAKLHQGNIFPVRRIGEVEKSLLSNSKRIIYLDVGADFSNPGNEVLSTLQMENRLVDKKNFHGIETVYTFVK